MSADYINIQAEKDRLADDNAKLIEQMNKMKHRQSLDHLVLHAIFVYVWLEN